MPDLGGTARVALVAGTFRGRPEAVGPVKGVICLRGVAGTARVADVVRVAGIALVALELSMPIGGGGITFDLAVGLAGTTGGVG